MKEPEATRVIYEVGGTPVRLRAWTKRGLRREDWDFSRLNGFPHDMLRAAWIYEVQRELGSGNKSYIEAWESQELRKRKARLEAHINCENGLSEDRLSEGALRALLPEIPRDEKAEEAKAALQILPDTDMTIDEADAYHRKELDYLKWKRKQLDLIARAEVRAEKTTWKPPTPREPEPMMKSYHKHEFEKMKIPTYYTWVNGSASNHCTIHPLEIDWMQTETELVEAFRNWLRKGDHYPFQPSYKRTVDRAKVGQRKEAGWISKLRELATYRISEAGIPRTQGIVMLGGGQVSPANWEHAQSRTSARIRQEEKRCEHSAWAQGAGSPQDWRDEFVKPFGL